MKKLLFYPIFLWFVPVFFLISCKGNKLEDVDVSSVTITPVKILRLDNDIFLTKPDSFKNASGLFQKKYGNFYTSFIFNVVNHGEEHDSVYKALKYFVSDPDMNAVYKQSHQIYTDEEIHHIENDLTAAFKHLKYHLPQAELPKQYVSFISGFNYNITTIDSTLGIGLDMYLGSQNKYYQMLQWPHYKTRCMSKEYIVPDAAKGWLIHLFDKSEQLNNLLNHMIFYGKLYYALDAVLPDTPDSVKISYSSAQIKYCKQYQKNLWAYFTDKNRLYTNDLKELSPYINDGPFTGTISKDCPPRIAQWVGWQIVRSYMDKNDKVTVAELMKETDAQKILSQSKYKP